MRIVLPDLEIEALSLSRLESLLADVGDESPVIFRRLLEIFSREAPERLREIREAVSAGNSFDLLQASHSLKSSSGNLGVERLRRICAFLEERAKREQMQDLEPWCDRIEEVYREGQKALADWIHAL
jgi:HPt (histidine-containing phosphotransfer) domain-containing protein